jgi:lipoprotein-anchoring transpeptidase ErfK/SrfK
VEGPSVARRLLVALFAFVLLALSGTMAWAVASDFRANDVVPAGVRLVSATGDAIDVGGLTRAELAARIETAVAEPVRQPIVVRFEDREFLLNVDAMRLVNVDASGMLAEAFRGRTEPTFATRVFRMFTRSGPTVDVKPLYSVDVTATGAWVAALAREVDKRAVDATRGVEGNRVYISESAPGVKTDQADAAEAIVRAALLPGASARTLTLPVSTLEPKVTKESFGRAIVVDKSERRLYLYDGDKIEKSYRVAVGMPGYPTPLGQFEIVLKRYRPTWSNPGSAWAKDMPAYIPPGPGNPLGTRALNLSAPGIRIHGTENIASIGTAASHGCIRMLRANVEELYELVEVGTTVYVVP